MRRPTWRPGLRWLPLGVGLGITAGALSGAALVVVTVLFPAASPDVGWTPGHLVFVIIMGALFGGVVGAGVGLVVGVPLVFLVGAHLPRRTAQARAFALGLVLPPLVLGTLVAAAQSFQDLSPALLLTPPVLGSAVLGGPLAGWAAGLDIR